jgi:hypothetical protein
MEVWWCGRMVLGFVIPSGARNLDIEESIGKREMPKLRATKITHETHFCKMLKKDCLYIVINQQDNLWGSRKSPFPTHFTPFLMGTYDS